MYSIESKPVSKIQLQNFELIINWPGTTGYTSETFVVIFQFVDGRSYKLMKTRNCYIKKLFIHKARSKACVPHIEPKQPIVYDRPFPPHDRKQ